jgi:hypothetical protein
VHLERHFVNAFDRLSDLSMKARAARRVDLVVERLADERVTELVEGARAVLLFPDDLRCERLVEEIEQRVFVLLGDRPPAPPTRTSRR